MTPADVLKIQKALRRFVGEEERRRLSLVASGGLPVIVTGATGGIGRCIALALALCGIRVMVGCRSRNKGEAVIADIKDIGGESDLLLLDLADSGGVRRAAASVRGEIAGIIHNAGLMARRYHVGPDGHEDTLDVNYYNTRLLTRLLAGKITSGGSVVFTTSVTRNWGYSRNLVEEIEEKDFGQLSTYSLSKKLITRYAWRLTGLEQARDEEASTAAEVAARGLRINCADPGIVDSGMISMDRWFDPLADIFFRPFIRSRENGAMPAVRAFASGESGRIFTLRRTVMLG